MQRPLQHVRLVLPISEVTGSLDHLVGGHD